MTNIVEKMLNQVEKQHGLMPRAIVGNGVGLMAVRQALKHSNMPKNERDKLIRSLDQTIDLTLNIHCQLSGIQPEELAHMVGQIIQAAQIEAEMRAQENSH